MKTKMKIAQQQLEEILESSRLTAGMYVRIFGDNLIMGRHEKSDESQSEPEHIDLTRLTRLGQSSYGLSVKRHTGRWEKTPFRGTMNEMVGCMCGLMQHLIAPL